MAVVTAPGSLLGKAARTRAAGQFAKRAKVLAKPWASVREHVLTVAAAASINFGVFLNHGAHDWTSWATLTVSLLVLDFKLQG